MGGLLFDRDWRFVCDSIFRINSSKRVDLLEEQSLECLMESIFCTQGTFFVTDETEEGLTFGRPVVAGALARYMDLFMGGEYDRDEYFVGTRSVNKTETFRDSDLMPEEYRVGTKLYKEIYSKQGIHFGLRSYLVYDGAIVGNISLFNAKEKGDFSDKDMRILNVLAPHIALKLGQLLELERGAFGVPRAEKAWGLATRFGLTGREAEAMHEALLGLSDREIAVKLGVSLSTVKKHIHNVYLKVGVGSRAQLMAKLRDF